MSFPSYVELGKAARELFTKGYSKLLVQSSPCLSSKLSEFVCIFEPLSKLTFRQTSMLTFSVIFEKM